MKVSTAVWMTVGVICTLLMLKWQRDCEATGGHYVKSVFVYECIK